jgi:hypothetical protein
MKRTSPGKMLCLINLIIIVIIRKEEEEATEATTEVTTEEEEEEEEGKDGLFIARNRPPLKPKLSTLVPPRTRSFEKLLGIQKSHACMHQQLRTMPISAMR